MSILRWGRGWQSDVREAPLKQHFKFNDFGPITREPSKTRQSTFVQAESSSFVRGSFNERTKGFNEGNGSLNKTG